MAYDIGPKIGIDGEKEYRQQMNNIITQAKTLQAEYRAMSSEFDKNTSAQKKAQAQTKLLTDQIKKQEEIVKSAEEMHKKAAESYGENDSRTLKWAKSVASANAELQRLNAELRNTPNQLQALGKDWQAAGQKIEAVGKKVESVGKGLTTHVTAPIMAVGMAAVKVTSDFDSSMSKVKAVSGATGSEFEALRNKAREMGATTQFSASEAAEAMNYMAMAGWKTEEMMSGIGGIMSLAAASGEDLATTSDIVTDALTAFGKSAGDAGELADIMAAASSNANTNVSMMGETFKYAAPVAGALGISMQDTAIAVGLMANAGIKASQAGTTLRGGLSRLVGPTKQVKDAMNKYGIEVEKNADGSVNLRETMKSLRKRMGQLSETEQTAAAKAIFGANAYAGWLAVINGSDKDFDKLTKAVDNSAGTAERMAKTMQDNLGGQLKILKSEMEELGISLGDVMMPKLREGVKWVQDLVDKFNQMSTAEKEQIVKMAAVAAAIGPVVTVGGKLISTVGSVVTVGGKAIEMIGGLSTAASAGATGVGLLGGAMGALPIIAVVGGIAALAAITYKLGQGFEDSQSKVVNLASGMDTTVRSAEATRKSLDDTVKSIDGLAKSEEETLSKTEANAKLAERYGTELSNLANKTNRTSSEQAKMRVLVDKLNKIYPDLNLAIDETTGNLNMSTDALKKNIAQLKEQAKAMAYNKIFEEELEKLVEVEKKVAEAEIAKDDAMAQGAEAAEREKQITAELNREQDELKEALMALDEAVRIHGAGSDEAAEAERRLAEAQAQVNDGMINLNGTMVDSNAAMMDAREAVAAAEEEERKLSGTITEGSTARDELTKKVEAAQQRAEEYSQSVGETTEAELNATSAADGLSTAMTEQAGAAGEAGAAMTDMSEEISAAWDKSYEAAQKSVMEQGNLFAELEEKSSTSLETMKENLEKHIEAYQSWHQNASTLMESEKYATDENFRAMVNYIISAGQDMAPELQALVDAYQNGDTSLEEITADYGAMSVLATQVATTTADAQTAAQYGLEGLQAVYGEGMGLSAAAVAEGQTQIGQEFAKGPESASQGMSGISAALLAKAPEIKAGADGIVAGIQSMPKSILAESGKASASAQNVASSAAKGLSSKKGEISKAARSVGNEAKEIAPAINAQQAGTLAAARGLGNQFTSTINSTKPQVQNASKAVGTEVRQIVVAANAQSSLITGAGRSSANALKTGLDTSKAAVQASAKGVGNQVKTIQTTAATYNGSVKSAGQTLGQKLADGINSKYNTVHSAGSSIANGGKSGITSTGTGGAYTWGQELGQNLADGIWSKYNAVNSAANALANAAAGPLHHSTPDEGPLMHDDVWGKELAMNFAKAMVAGSSYVRAGAMEIAQAAYVPAYMDPTTVSGRGSLTETIRHSIDISQIGGLDPEQIYEAVRAGASSITIQIGERELGRALRDMGVAFA